MSDKKFGVISDTNSSLIDHYEADIVSATDYYPFGMPSRVSLTGKGYRFGFNGKENDNDVKGWGNQQDYGMRIYDPRVGRFLSVDPISKEYPELTPYQFASNRPIDGIDQDGLEYTPAKPNNGDAKARDATAMKVAMNPNDYFINPHSKSVVPIRYPIISPGNPGVPPFPTNTKLFAQWDVPKNQLEKDQQRIARERNYLEAGYNADGSKPPLMRLSENKTWNSFSNNLALPLLEGYTYLSGAGELRFLIKGGYKALFESSTKALGKNVAQFERLKAALAQEEIKAAEAVGSALKADKYHRSASFVVDDIAENGRFFTFKGGDGQQYNLTQVTGELNGEKGIYEWIVNSENKLTHQRFIKDGKITGTPNQKVR